MEFYIPLTEQGNNLLKSYGYESLEAVKLDIMANDTPNVVKKQLIKIFLVLLLNHSIKLEN